MDTGYRFVALLLQTLTSAGAVAIFILWMYRSELSEVLKSFTEFIGRLRKFDAAVGGARIQAEAAAQQNASKDKAPDGNALAADKPLPSGTGKDIAFELPTDRTHPKWKSASDVLDAALTSFNGTRFDPHRSVAELAYWVVTFQTELDFERIYRVIFGSQIDLLETLNTVQELSPQDPLVLGKFVAARTTWPPGFVNYTMEQWIHFLAWWRLVENFTSPDGVAKLRVTEKGRDFLKFIVDGRLAKTKPF